MLTPIEKGDKNKNDRVAAPESVPIYLSNCSVHLDLTEGGTLSIPAVIYCSSIRVVPKF